jgi:hypothetical protein
MSPRLKGYLDLFIGLTILFAAYVLAR